MDRQTRVITVFDVTKYIGSVIINNPVCIETGCTYIADTASFMHTTTNNIFYNICQNNDGKLFSFDEDAEHIKTARTLCGGSDKVEFIHGDSVFNLINFFSTRSYIGYVDVLCLDSKEFDPDHAVNEFNAVKMYLRPRNHFILVDDIHNLNSVKYKKIVPILKDIGYSYIEVPTPTGMFMASVGYPLPSV